MPAHARIVLVIVALFLTACEIEFTTPVRFSELLDPEAKYTTATLEMEADCSSREDVRSLRQDIEDIFEGADFIGCSQRTDRIEYAVPVAFDRANDRKPESTKHVNVVSFDPVLIGMYLPKEMSRKIQAANTWNNPLEIEAVLHVTNDTQESFLASFENVYVGKTPSLRKRFTVEPGDEFEITLGDVLVDAIRLDGGQAFVFGVDEEQE